VTGSTGFVCQACGDAFYCPGAKITASSSTVRLPCGAFTTTTTQYARSERECSERPRRGRAAGRLFAGEGGRRGSGRRRGSSSYVRRLANRTRGLRRADWRDAAPFLTPFTISPQPHFRSAVVLPGYGWGAANASAACDVGFYNPGFNTRACTK
jgi:hypothetical protein